MTAVDLVADKYAEGRKVTLDDIGGEDVLWAASTELAASPVLPLVTQLICDSWSEIEDKGQAEELVLEGARVTSSDLALADMLDVTLSCAALLERIGDRLSDALVERSRLRDTEQEAMLAARALDGAARLALGEWSSRFRILDTLSRVTSTEAGPFAERVTRLIGICYERWKESELRRALERLISVAEAEAEASFELGMVLLLDAFESSTRDDVIAGLREARQWLARAEAADEDRSDAAAYGAVLDVLLGFDAGKAPNDLQVSVSRARELVARRQMWLFGMHQSWLTPRYQAEVEWVRLCSLLTDVARNLNRPSWWEPGAALEQALEVYAASRSFRLLAHSQDRPGGIDVIIEPRVEASFLRHEGLRAHLMEWLSRAPDDDPHRSAATALVSPLDSKKKVQQ